MTADPSTLPALFNHEEFQKAAVQCMLGAFDVDTLAAMHGISVDEAATLIETHADPVSRSAAQAVADGLDVSAVAKRTLRGALGQLSEQVQDGGLSTGTLLKVVEMMNKVSGLEAKQRTQPEQTERFIFTIHLGTDETITFDNQATTVNEPDEPPGFMRTLAEAGENLNAGGKYE